MRNEWKRGAPSHENEVLCKVKGHPYCKYAILRHVYGDWCVYTYIGSDSGGWCAFPGKVTGWMDIREESKKLTIQNIHIGDMLCDKNNKFPMEVVTIHSDGTIYLDFDGNEGDLWEERIEDLERVQTKKK